MKIFRHFMAIRNLLIYHGILYICACSWATPATRDNQRSPYFEKIKQWQEQINKEGWSATMVDRILDESRGMTHYQMEFEDEWLTPEAFIRAGFNGDCEDIAIFMMGSLKRLAYPHTVRILVINDLFANHAQLKVQMPDGNWKWYESTRARSYRRRPGKWRPIVEFDEHAIQYYTPPKPRQISLYP